jgi:hypothetical protein
MQLNAPELLQPVFEFLDDIIREDGDILFMLFTMRRFRFWFGYCVEGWGANCWPEGAARMFRLSP